MKGGKSRKDTRCIVSKTICFWESMTKSILARRNPKRWSLPNYLRPQSSTVLYTTADKLSLSLRELLSLERALLVERVERDYQYVD